METRIPMTPQQVAEALLAASEQQSNDKARAQRREEEYDAMRRREQARAEESHKAYLAESADTIAHRRSAEALERRHIESLDRIASALEKIALALKAGG